jgi:membrane-associated phospholipid phosphatase
VQAVTYSEAITQTLKIAFGRARPFENEGAFSYYPLNISRIGFHSLPGGHNTEGWAMSTVLSRNAHSRALKVIAYVPAVLTFVSRIYQDQHWTSDDFLGAAIGFAVATWVVNQHDHKESALSTLAVSPFTINFSF